MAGKKNDKSQDVFDVANWLDRANGRSSTPAASPADGESAPIAAAYAPRHRADVPVDSVA